MLYPRLQATIAAAVGEFAIIDGTRRALLAKMTGYIRTRLDAGEPVRLTFICTHNARRSQLAQVWAQTAAAYYRLAGVDIHSGGTQATAVHGSAVGALVRAGFRMEVAKRGENPVYRVHACEEGGAMTVFSKVLDQGIKPLNPYCAVMTCAEAESACPIAQGADARISLTYEDPKIADGTPGEAAVYDTRCRQICRELFFAFAGVHGQ